MPTLQKCNDTVSHRVWQCTHPDAIAQRRKNAPEHLIQQALEDPKHSKWVTGLVEHPECCDATPALKGGIVCLDAMGCKVNPTQFFP